MHSFPVLFKQYKKNDPENSPIYSYASIVKKSWSPVLINILFLPGLLMNKYQEMNLNGR